MLIGCQTSLPKIDKLQLIGYLAPWLNCQDSEKIFGYSILSANLERHRSGEERGVKWMQTFPRFVLPYQHFSQCSLLFLQTFSGFFFNNFWENFFNKFTKQGLLKNKMKSSYYLLSEGNHKQTDKLMWIYCRKKLAIYRIFIKFSLVQ